MIKRIQIFGERCSGTTYLEYLIRRNFSGIDVTWEYGWKHFFPVNIDDYSDDCLFIVIFRNPFDWIRGFHRNAHHGHSSIRNIPFSQFIRSEWKAVWKDDIEMEFERDGNKRFENSLKLRSAKIKAFLDLKNNVKNFCFINYEDLRENINLLRDIANRFGIILKYAEIFNVEERGNTKERFVPIVYEDISMEDLKFIKSNLNWELESKIGYSVNDYKVKSLLVKVRGLLGR